MYRIELDHLEKMIRVELSGYMEKEEVVAFSREVNALLSELKSKEYSMYASLERMDPVSQDSLPYLISTSKNLLLHLRKIAVVHKRTVTQMQMRRIESIAKENEQIDNRIMRFYSRRDAMNYLRKY
jgi:hypothetical protein